MTEERFILEQYRNFHTVIDTIENKPIGVFEFKENEFGKYACFHIIIDKMNKLYEEKEQLLSDKEHLMGCLIRFFGYDDEDIDYNLNRESNREYGKQYYEMKEEDW